MNCCKYFIVFLLLLASSNSFSQEICNNGKDDDGDGLIDLQDPDCQCHFNVSGNLLRNGSFELYKNCPTNYSYSNDHDIVNYWEYANHTGGNVAQYYHNFNCSYDSEQVMLYTPPELPLPDGKAFVSIRQYVYRKPDMTEKDIAKVYVSQCLQQPLLPQVPYTMSFSAGRFQSNDDRNFKFKTEPFTVAVFGNKNCNAVPFGPENALSNGCPANFGGWILLGKTTLRSKGKWVQSKISFVVPEEISVIAIGPDCSVLPSPQDLADSTTYLDFYVYDIDDIHLLTTPDFHFFYIRSDKENACEKDTVLSVPFFSNTSYQWYKDSVAIVGATSNSYQLPSKNYLGNYNVLISNVDSCLISEPYTVIDDPLENLVLPADTTVCENDSLQLAPMLDGITYSWNGNTGNSVEVYNPGVYNINAASLNGCSKQFTLKVHSQNCNLLMPNAFTPNDDGKNDVFRIPVTAKIDLEAFSIYDRWGNKVFSTNDKLDSWDGTYNGKKSTPGIYIYVIQGKKNNKSVKIKGFVTLIR